MKNRFAAILCACVMTTAILPVQASAAPDMSGYADEVTALVNRERAAEGLAPLYAVPVLCELADVRAEELSELFSHTRPDDTLCYSILDDNNIRYYAFAENIAYGYDTPAEVVDGWMHSEGHRANILDSYLEYLGVGVYYENGTYYWVQLFTGGVELPDAYLPVMTEPEPTEPEILRGDVDADGVFTVADIVMLQKYLLGVGMLTQPEAADLYADGVTDIYDLALMKREMVRI